jgi:hypothetical protein
MRDRLLDLGHRVFCPEGEDLKVADNRQIYRKLPGRRRGFIFSASLWTGADHLLSVRNTRFQEQYKRFYFRDIHAIVITRVPRFVVSTPMLVSALLLLITFLVVRLRLPAVTEWLWLLAALLVAGWLFISWKQSCTCRLYTAVSREDLPSLCRIWSARQALAELERHISQVQGVFTEDWAAAADARSLGPARPADAPNSAAPTVARSRTWVSDVFLASLLADAALTAYLIRSPIPLLANVSVALTLVQIAAAIGIFVQRHRGILRTGMQRLAIATLLFIGVTTYAQMMGDAFQDALAGRRRMLPVQPRRPSGMVRPIYSGGAALLALAGFVLSFKPE